MSEAVATQQQELAGKYPPYLEYKDSGVEWVGDIPCHWQSKPAFAVVMDECIKNSDGAESNVLSLSYGNIVERDVETNFGLLPESFNTYQIVNPGDIVLRLTDLQNDKRSLRVGRSTLQGIITSAYLKLSCGGELNDRYAYRLLHSYDTTKVFYGMGGGLRQSMKFEDFRRLPFLVPPLEEQCTIAAFLDYETTRIDRLIAKQQQLIELLKEKRQTVISHAVTKGLNPDAPMKDSGVEWLGQVPEHWVVSDLSYTLSAIADIDHYMPESVDIGVPYLMTGDLKNFAHEIDFSECKQVSYVEYGKLSRKIQASIGDVIVARYATIGTATYVDIDKEFLVSYACVTVKPNLHKVAGLYLYYFIKSHSFLEGLLNKVNTNTQGNVGINDLKKVKISLPDVQEQGEVVLYLESITKKIDSLSRQAERAITLMNERRTALISAAVTGKIDLRGWTAPTDEVVA